jgi:hypothetical protein
MLGVRSLPSDTVMRWASWRNGEKKMELFEIEWRELEDVKDGDTPDPANTVTRSEYARTKTEAMRVITELASPLAEDGTPRPVLDGTPTVFRCELDLPAGRVSALFALLNGEIDPVRTDLVHGQIPLPLRGTSA